MTTPVLFLDDASRHSGDIDRACAEKTAKTLIDTLRCLRKVNNRIALNMAQRISECQIAKGWTLPEIFRGNAFKDEWDFIRSLSDRCPFSAGLADSIRHEIDRMEFHTKSGKVPSIALAWATLLDSATVGFNAHPDWSLAWIDAIYCKLDDDGNLHEAENRVRNASQPAHVGEHIDWLRLFGLSADPTAAQIWNERIDRFPGLRFLSRVEKDLNVLEGSGIPFSQAVKSLHELTNDVANWAQDDGVWPRFSRKASPEDEQRKNLCWVFDEVTEKKELFDWHTRFTGSFPGRVHFRVDVAEKSIIVAYVGTKLTREISS